MWDGVIVVRTADGAEDYLRDLGVRGQTVGDAFPVLGNEKEQFGCRRELTQEFLELTEQPRCLIGISGGMIGGEEALDYLNSLSRKQCLQEAGVLSNNFWLAT